MKVTSGNVQISDVSPNHGSVTVRTIVETSQTRTLHTALPGPVALDSSNAVMAVASLRTGNVTWMMTVVTTLMNRWRSAVSGICIFIVYFNHLEICFIRSLSQSICLLMNPFVWTTVGPAFRCDNHTEFDCKTNYRCVPLWSVCNGQNDCRDNSDEQGCGECWLKKNQTTDTDISADKKLYINYSKK